MNHKDNVDVQDDENGELLGENSRHFNDDRVFSSHSRSFTKKDYILIICSLSATFILGLLSYHFFLPQTSNQSNLPSTQPVNNQYLYPQETPTMYEEEVNRNIRTASPTKRPHLENMDNEATSEPTKRPHNEEDGSTPEPTKRPHRDEEEEIEEYAEEEEKEEENDIEENEDKFVSELGLSQYPGLDELKEVQDGEYLQKMQEIFKDKHKKIRKSNENLADKNIPASDEFKWDDFHVTECTRINNNFDKKFLSLDSEYNRKDRLRVFTTEWSSLVEQNDHPLLGFDPSKVSELLKEFRSSLVLYYEVENEENFLKLFDVNLPVMHSDEFNLAIKKTAGLFLSRIARKEAFRFATYGTSVIAGQDNCWYNSYPMLLQRIFDKMFTVFNNENIKVSVLPGGQNGNGANVYPQARCLYDITNSFDVVQLGYWMIPFKNYEIETLVRRAVLEGKVVHSLDSLTFVKKGKDFRNFEKYLDKLNPYFAEGILEWGDHVWAKGFDLEGVFPWWPIGKNHWGRVGDGRCHIKTREGADGTFMQNWHPGPLGFQMMADRSLFYYSLALSYAMKLLENHLKEFSGNDSEKFYSYLQGKYPTELPLPDISQIPIASSDVDCATIEPTSFEAEVCYVDRHNTFRDITCYHGYNPMYRQDRNITNLVTPGEEGNWKYKVVKVSSYVGSCRDRSFREDPSVYKSRPECNEHPDSGYGYEALPGSDWLKFNLPKLKQGRVDLCHFGHKYNTEMDNIKVKLDGKDVTDMRMKYSSCMSFMFNDASRKPTKLEVKYFGDDKISIGFVILQ